MKLAVSACLLGEKIRFDGGHKHYPFITKELGQFAEFIPFCPEHNAFGTPRPSVRTVHIGGEIRILSNATKEDLTESLQKACNAEYLKISNEPLCGIILKSKSPSCGLKSSKLYLENGMVEGKTDGLFASKCRQEYPLLPIEEEGRLEDPWLRENFVMQIFAYKAFEILKQKLPAISDLVTFHTQYKFLLQSKNEKLYRELGNIVANRDKKPFEKVFEAYEIGFKTALAHKSSIKKTRNILEHMAGFFKNDLTSEEKETLHIQITDYASKIIPLIVPLSTIHLYAKKYKVPYLLEQKFLEPYPKTLALRSHIVSGK